MNEYEQQARAFLDDTKSTLKIRYVEYGFHFAEDEEKRDIWEVKLSKGSREYVFRFGSSIINRENLLKKCFPRCNAKYAQRGLNECYDKRSHDSDINRGVKAYKDLMERVKEYGEAGKDQRPTSYSVLACLQAYEPDDNVDDFADEFGYDKPSVAIRVFEAVTKEYRSLAWLYCDDELQKLSEIQ